MDFASSRIHNSDWKGRRIIPRKKQGKIQYRSTSNKRRGINSSGRFTRVIRFAADVIAKVALMAAFSYVAYHGYSFLTMSPQFNINNVSIQGNQRLDEQEVLEWAGPVQKENIFRIDMAALADRLIKHPWIFSASIERTLPDKLRISIRERTPYAKIKLDRTYILDNHGVILTSSELPGADLPLIIGMASKSVEPGDNILNDTIIQGLHSMYYLNRMSFFQDDPIDTFQIMEYNRVAFTTRNLGMRIYFDLETLSESFQNFLVFLDVQQESVADIESIDLSFKDRIVVKSLETLTEPASSNVL